MKNNKGMTIIELVITFVLLMFIVAALFGLILNTRDSSSTKAIYKSYTEYNSQIIKVIQEDLIMNDVTFVDDISDTLTDDEQKHIKCFNFSFDLIPDKELRVDVISKVITYDGIKYEIPNSDYMEFLDEIALPGSEVEAYGSAGTGELDLYPIDANINGDIIKISIPYFEQKIENYDLYPNFNEDRENLGFEITHVVGLPDNVALPVNPEPVVPVVPEVFVCNAPEIGTNMYPVKWNGSSWVVTSATDDLWYTYNGDIDNSGDTNKDDGTGEFVIDQWANVQISTAVLSEGDLISEADLNLYVWIPRYTYLLNESAKTVSIKYTEGISDDTSSSYIVHPGFTFGTQNLTGIWVAKFEMSANTVSDNAGTPAGAATGVSKPNGKSWRHISVNDVFNESRTIESVFGISANSHMIKSSEWGAVAYLTEAIRDGEEVWINNQGNVSYVYLTTGCASSTTKNADYSNRSSWSCTSGYDYKTAGVKASTTGNIYGVYDLSGGAVEYVATYIDDNTDGRLTSTTYDYALASAADQYKEKLTVSGATDTTNYYNARYMTTGYAIHETSTEGAGATAWYNDYTYFPYSGNPAIRRGGQYNSGSTAGMYAFDRKHGGTSGGTGWRVALVL